MTARTIFIALLALLSALISFSTGCNRKKTAEKEKSNSQILLEGFTGKSSIDRGKQAEATIRKVSIKKDQDLKEVMGE